MRRTALSSVMALLAVLVAASGMLAQEPTPASARMPYEEYVAALAKFGAASSESMAALGPTSTVDDVVAAYVANLALVAADQQRLRTIVPEPCYADAHMELYAYRETAIALLEDALPELGASETVIDLVPIIEAMDAELHARHPSAFVADSESSGGFKGSPRNILAALATCDAAMSPQTAAPSAAPSA